MDALEEPANVLGDYLPHIHTCSVHDGSGGRPSFIDAEESRPRSMRAAVLVRKSGTESGQPATRW